MEMRRAARVFPWPPLRNDPDQRTEGLFPGFGSGPITTTAASACALTVGAISAFVAGRTGIYHRHAWRRADAENSRR